ncbi:hypothetical protein LINPERPRIM_LOCUS27236 [Linum perenne]
MRRTIPPTRRRPRPSDHLPASTSSSSFLVPSIPPPSTHAIPSFSLFPSFSLSVIATERPRQMKLRVMGDWFKEVAEWWDEVHTVEEIKPEPVFSKQEDEESVNVERTGDDVLGI